MKLYYSHNLNPRVAVAVARYLQSPVDFVRASPRHPECEQAFRAVNPNTLVPVLVEDDRTLWETDTIACRLSSIAKSDFWPTDDRAPELQMWISWSTHHFTRAASAFYWEYVVKPTFGDVSVDTRALEEAAREFHRFATVLEDVLSNRIWLVHNLIRAPAVHGSGSEWSGQLAAMMFSLLMTMKRWQINPHTWLSDYLNACAAAGNRAPPDLQPYLPWSMEPAHLAQMRRAPCENTSIGPVETVDTS